VVAVGGVFSLLFMIGMTAAVWLTGRSARQGNDPTPAQAVEGPASKPSPIKKGRRSVSRAARPFAAKPVARLKQGPAYVPEAQPLVWIAAEKPAVQPFQRMVQRPIKKVKKDPIPERAVAQYGTTVDFWNNPFDADSVAKKKDRLRFVLHISGNFEDPGCT
jgi:hypothetical protein